jgi:ABC-type multidrug transport system fused ATPase/permease subunit
MKQSRNFSWSSFQSVTEFAGKYKGWIVISVLALLLNAAMEVSAGFAVKLLTDSTLNGLAPWKDIRTILFLIVLVVFSVGAKLFMGIFTSRFSISVVRDMRGAITRRFDQMRLSDLEDQSGRTVSRMTSDMNVVQGFLQNEFPNVVYSLVLFVLVFVYLSVLNWKLALTAVTSVPVTLFLIDRLSRPLIQYARNEQEGREQIAAIAQDAAGGMYIEKAYNLQGWMNDRFNQAVNRVLQYSLLYQRRTSYLNPIQSILRWIPLLSVAILGGYLTLRGEMTTGSLFAFIFLLSYLVEPLSNIQDFISQVQKASVSAERIGELIRLPEENVKGILKAGIPDSPMISFEGVSYSYTGHQDTLKEVSFEVAQGKSVAFVGSSGSGKSTLFKLISGFIQPGAGQAKLMGHNLSDWNLDEARKHLSIVTQEAFLFPGTIMENISYGRPGASIEEIIEAAKQANAHEFIVQLKDGYHSYVGERGVKLSGGQRQRLTIARAFLKNAPLLLLDEPTSALDSQSEALVQEALERMMKGRTVLIIAHRMSTIIHSDEIFVMHEGRIVERGTHDSLMANQKWYMELYSNQQESSERSAPARSGGAI